MIGMDARKMMKGEHDRPGWGLAGLSIALLLLLVLWLYQETILSLGERWAQFDSAYGHGFLVLALSFYVVYRQRQLLAKLVPCPGITGLFAIAACTLLWLLATLVDVQTVQNVVLVPLLLSIIWAAAGGRAARQLLFPVMFLVFAIPLWEPLLPVLQVMTAEVSFRLTRTAGVPAMLQDFVVILPVGNLMIAEACSGLSYLLAALTLGVFYAYLNYRLLWQRVVVVMIAAATALLANILRVFIVIYLAYISDMQHPMVADHLSLGWYLFAGLVFILLLIDIKLHRHAASPVVGDGPDHPIVNAGNCVFGMRQRLILLVVSGALLALGPAMARWMERPVDAQPGIVLDFPDGAGGWSGPLSTQDDWMPVYHGAVAGKRAYRQGGHEMYLYLGYYPAQSQGSELINDLNRISDDKTWHTQYSHARITLSGTRTILEQVLVSRSGQTRLVWYWYQVAGQTTVNPYVAKLLQVKGLVTGNPDAAVIAMATDIHDGVATARELLAEFMGVMEHPLLRTGNGNSLVRND